MKPKVVLICLFVLLFVRRAINKKRSAANRKIDKPMMRNPFGSSNNKSLMVSDSIKVTEKTIIEKLLTDYDAHVRPRGMDSRYFDGSGGPVLVTVNMYLRSLHKIDEINMEYSTQFTFRQEWKDSRLAYSALFDGPSSRHPPFIILPTSNESIIWKPDTFFQNEREAHRHMIDKPNTLMRVYPDGKVLYSIRLTMKLSCPMSLEHFPFDKQTCTMDLASYAHSTEDIIYQWEADNPIQLKSGLSHSMPNFDLQRFDHGYCTSRTATGEYSCLRASIFLQRMAGYFIIRFYIPSIMWVIISWLSFWLDKDKTTARLIIGIVTLLMMSNQSLTMSATLPPVSYIKAVDTWNGACLAFIFTALLEFITVSYTARKDEFKKTVLKLANDQQTDSSNGNKSRSYPTAIQTIPPSPNQHFGQNYPMATAPHEALSPNYPSLNQNDAISQGALEESKQNLWMQQQHRNAFLMPSLEHGNENWSFDPRYANYFMPPYGAKVDGVFNEWLLKYERAKRIDMISRIIFPIAFIIFNCIYWPVYTYL